MNDVTVIDRFLATFSRYIDSGFGLLQGEVAFLTATLIVIDMTIAGLYWAMSHATGQGDDVIAKLLRKEFYVGAFAYIINNFNWLAGIVFRSFAGLGLVASGSTMSMGDFLQPGRLAKTGIDAAAPILKQIGDMAGFPEVFVNLTPIVVMFLAWAVVILCFFVLAIQLFVTLIEFKLTTLAGFVLVPFALWNKTSFLAEKVLGNVVSSGIKVLVLAVIVGIGSGLFAEFQVHPAEPSIDHAVVIMLASLTLLALGIFGPGIATGLVSGAPQLGAGAMAGAAVGAAGAAVAVGAAATGVGGAVMAGARMAPAAAKLAGAGARAATSAAGSAKSAFQAGSAAAGGGAKGAMAGLGNVAKSGAQAAGQRAGAGIKAATAKAGAPFKAGWQGSSSSGASGAGSSQATTGEASAQKQEQPGWAKNLQRRQQLTQATTYAAPGYDPNDALRKEEEAAAASSVFFRTGSSQAAPVAQSQVAAAPGFAANAAFDPLAAGPASTAAQPADPTAVQNLQDQKEAFLQGGSTETRNSGNLQMPASPYQVMAGTVIAGALVTGIKSDLPGDVIATVTEPIYDTATGKFLLIPQGSRILGKYNSQVSYGQSRVQVVWNRIILPDTSSLTLDNLIGTDPAGYAGLEDDVGWHWDRIFAGAVLTTLLGVGAELAAPENQQGGDRVIIAGRDSLQDTVNQVGQEVSRRNLNIQPTLTSRPGLPVRIIVNRDLVLRPYQPLFFNKGTSR